MPFPRWLLVAPHLPSRGASVDKLGIQVHLFTFVGLLFTYCVQNMALNVCLRIVLELHVITGG